MQLCQISKIIEFIRFVLLCRIALTAGYAFSARVRLVFIRRRQDLSVSELEQVTFLPYEHSEPMLYPRRTVGSRTMRTLRVINLACI